MLQRSVDPAAVEAEIERVRSLSGDALRRRWRGVFGRSAPQHLTADLLRRMIVNRIQEEAFGTLDRATLKLLDGLARRDGSRVAERNLKIGTVLVRDYQGRRHTVTVEAEGYVWEGEPYSSLSADRAGHPGTAAEAIAAGKAVEKFECPTVEGAKRLFLDPVGDHSSQQVRREVLRR